MRACVCVCVCVAPWATAHQAPLSMKLSGQEYWSGVPFLTPGDLPNPGIKPASPTSPALQADSFTAESLGKFPEPKDEKI